MPEKFRKLREECKPYLMCGKEELNDLLEKLYENYPKVKVPAEDFRFLAKYLLYCTSTIELPIGQIYDKAMTSALTEQGKLENVKLWCFPTPEQKMTLTKSHILFLSAFGTGKTLLMSAKACELAKQGEKVLFLLFNRGDELFHRGDVDHSNTLLYIKMKLEYQETPNVVLKQVNFLEGKDNGLTELMRPYDHIFIDELFEDFVILKPECKNDFIHATMGKKTLWMAMSGSYHANNSYTIDKEEIDQLPEIAKQWFPTLKLEIIQMKIPLRSPSFVPEYIQAYHSHRDRQKMDINTLLVLNLEESPTLSEGTLSDVIIDETDSMAKDLAKCFEKVPKDQNGLISQHALIIIDECAMYGTTKDHIFCDCKKSYVKLIFDAAFDQIMTWNPKLGLKPPLYWIMNNQSPIEEIEKWIKEKHNFLITSHKMARGFTADLIINFGVIETIARCSNHVISVNQPLSMMRAIPLIYHCESHIGRTRERCGKVPKLKEPLEVLDAIIANSNKRLKRSEIFEGYAHNSNPLMSALHDLIINDPKLDDFVRTQVPPSELIVYARHKLRTDPTTMDTWRSFFAQYADMSENELRSHVMSTTNWSKYGGRVKFMEVENTFLNIMAACLKRRVVLQPLFRKDIIYYGSKVDDPAIAQDFSPWIFQRQYKDTYHIFCERRAKLSYYVSTQTVQKRKKHGRRS